MLLVFIKISPYQSSYTVDENIWQASGRGVVKIKKIFLLDLQSQKMMMVLSITVLINLKSSGFYFYLLD